MSTKLDPCGLKYYTNMDTRTHALTKNCHLSRSEPNSYIEYGQGIAIAEKSPLSDKEYGTISKS